MDIQVRDRVTLNKEVVEKKIEYYKNLIEECKNDEEHYGEIYLYEIYIDVLQKLLEEK